MKFLIRGIKIKTTIMFMFEINLICACFVFIYFTNFFESGRNALAKVGPSGIPWGHHVISNNNPYQM